MKETYKTKQSVERLGSKVNEHQTEISVQQFLMCEKPRIHYSLPKIAKNIKSIDIILKSAQKLFIGILKVHKNYHPQKCRKPLKLS